MIQEFTATLRKRFYQKFPTTAPQEVLKLLPRIFHVSRENRQIADRQTFRRPDQEIRPGFTGTNGRVILAENAFQVFLGRLYRHNVEVFHQDLEHIR